MWRFLNQCFGIKGSGVKRTGWRGSEDGTNSPAVTLITRIFTDKLSWHVGRRTAAFEDSSHIKLEVPLL